MNCDTTYSNEEEKYLAWFDDARKNKGLVDIKFHSGEIKLSSKEEFYREANHFNDQLDKGNIKPIYKVVF